MKFGAAFTFMDLVVSLVLGALVYVVLSPLFSSLTNVAIMMFGLDQFYPDFVVSAAYLILKFISFSGVFFFFLTALSFLKSYLQPWTSEYQ